MPRPQLGRLTHPLSRLVRSRTATMSVFERDRDRDREEDGKGSLKGRPARAGEDDIAGWSPSRACPPPPRWHVPEPDAHRDRARQH